MNSFCRHAFGVNMKSDTRSIDSLFSFTRKSTLSAEKLSCRFSRSDTVAVGRHTRCLCLLRSLRCQVMFPITSLKIFGVKGDNRRCVHKPYPTIVQATGGNFENRWRSLITRDSRNYFFTLFSCRSYRDYIDSPFVFREILIDHPFNGSRRERLPIDAVYWTYHTKNNCDANFSVHLCTSL